MDRVQKPITTQTTKCFGIISNKNLQRTLQSSIHELLLANLITWFEWQYVSVHLIPSVSCVLNPKSPSFTSPGPAQNTFSALISR
jgi:hypothetical protein